MLSGESFILDGIDQGAHRQTEHNASSKQESCSRQEVFIRMGTSQFTPTLVCGCVNSTVCVCGFMGARVSVCMCDSALVVSYCTLMLLTPLTPSDTSLEARDQEHKHDGSLEVR